MADLQELLSSISDEDMARIKNMAESIMGKSENTSAPEKNTELPLDMNSISKIMNIMGKMGTDNYRARLINDLKPLLSEERRQKADEAIKFLQLMEILPLLRGMF